MSIATTAPTAAQPLTEICRAIFGPWSRYCLTVEVSTRFKPEGEVLFSVCDAEQDGYPIRVERDAYTALADFEDQHNFATARPRKGDWVINLGTQPARFIGFRNDDYLLELPPGGSGTGERFIAAAAKCLVLRKGAIS